MSAISSASHRDRSFVQDLGLVAHQFRFELLGFMRNRQARFFTVMLPVVFLVIFVEVFGNHTLRLPSGATIKESTYYVPSLTALGIISAAFTSLVVAVVGQRENGILKRRRASPVPAYVLIGGRALLAIVVALFMCALMVIIGSVFFGATVPSHTIPGLAAAAILGAICFCCTGYALSTFIRQFEAVQPVVQITLLPLYFISGVFVPSTIIDQKLRDVAKIFPVQHLGAALLHAYDPKTTGAGFSWGDLAVMGAWAAGGLIAALRRFSWSPMGK